MWIWFTGYYDFLLLVSLSWLPELLECIYQMANINDIANNFIPSLMLHTIVQVTDHHGSGHEDRIQFVPRRHGPGQNMPGHDDVSQLEAHQEYLRRPLATCKVDDDSLS